MSITSEWENNHKCCPKCGNTKLLVTLVGVPVIVDDNGIEHYEDNVNHFECNCGHSGMIKELIPERNNGN